MRRGMRRGWWGEKGVVGDEKGVSGDGKGRGDEKVVVDGESRGGMFQTP
jgi:hypothetical protein